MTMLVLRALVVSIVLAIPAIASACPQCAQNDGSGTTFLIMLGIMILLPYPVAAGVYYLIKQGDQHDHPVV
jgi:hypothetical protein